MAEWFLTPAERAAVEKAKKESEERYPRKPYALERLERVKPLREWVGASRELRGRLRKILLDEGEGYVKYSQILEFAKDEQLADLVKIIEKIMTDEYEHQKTLESYIRSIEAEEKKRRIR